jgi:hypothetical protein
MDKELIRVFILEYKQEQEGKARYKANHIKMHNYFKYSGEVEEYKKEYKWEKNKDIQERIKNDNPIIQFYFDNCIKYTIKEMSKKLKIGEGTVRYVLSKHFNNKKIEKWKKY